MIFTTIQSNGLCGDVAEAGESLLAAPGSPPPRAILKRKQGVSDALFSFCERAHKRTVSEERKDKRNILSRPDKLDSVKSILSLRLRQSVGSFRL